jgi:2-oxoglutarate dehydrogenase E2 component (dihydrolipoamide succinyltransferase)
VGLGFMSFFTRACVEAFKVVPEVNASIDGRNIIYRDYADVGVAVGTERGLVVPVLRDTHKMGFADIEKKIVELATKAKDGKLSIADMSGGTFTISNGGVYGSMMSTPILTPPQSGILGMHNIVERPVVVDKQIVIRPMMYLALSYDHRLIDGKGAVTFLVTLRDLLEHPEKLKLEY